MPVWNISRSGLLLRKVNRHENETPTASPHPGDEALHQNFQHLIPLARRLLR